MSAHEIEEEIRVPLGPRRPEDESDESDHECALFLGAIPDQPNSALDALTALAEEETTPEQRAECHKLEGNEVFGHAVKCPHQDRKRQLFNEAYEYYTKALAERSPDDKAVSIYYSNRATVNFHLKNFGKAISDCRWALNKDGTNVKAAYRAVLSAKTIGKHDLLIKYASIALGMPNLPEEQRGPVEAYLRAAKLSLQIEQESARAEQARLAEIEQRRRAVMQTKHEALAQRGLTLGRLRWKGEDARLIAHTKDAPVLDEAGTLFWPVLFVYDEYGQTDFIESFCELDSFAEHLEMMFPHAGVVPWDEHGQYIHSNLEIFLDTADENRLHRNYEKIDPQLSLLQALQKYHHHFPIPGLPVFYILPKMSTHIIDS